MRDVIYTACGICLMGILACTQADEPGTQQVQDPITIKLTNNNGDLEYCDANGECTTLPYDGDCAVVEIDIDQRTGNTCERCVLADGTVSDLGCVDTNVGCVLVTLPDPDCVVCAYVNGAIIFSTCTEQDSPDCYVSADCRDENGFGGFCLDGNCVYEPGCRENADCPPGFQCEYAGNDEPTPTDDPANPSDPDWATDPDDSPVSPGWYGTCVPRDVDCFSDFDCPPHMYCQSWCYGEDPVVGPCGDDGSCPDGFACLDGMCEPTCEDGMNCARPAPPPNCQGICQPYYENPCANVECPRGMHCEAYEVYCFAAPCPPVAECIPDYRECTGDLDCPDGFSCITEVCPAMPCYADGDCPPCYGICQPSLPEYCYSDDECGPGMTCEFYYEQGVTCDADGSCDVPAIAAGVCVPSSVWCQTNDECGEMALCVDGECVFRFDCDASHAYCDMMPPTCPEGQVITVLNGCYGPCVDPYMCEPAQQGCIFNEECPPMHECLVYCWDCWEDSSGVPNPDCGAGCEGVCVPFEPYCQSDDECYDAAGNMGNCEGGWCIFETIGCDDTTCPEGLVCEEICEGLGDCDSSDPNNCFLPPMECYSICMAPPSDDCFRTGCSGEICADRDTSSACVYLEEYRCLDSAICERQVDGSCGWTSTDEAVRCILEEVDRTP
ncbi:MAG: hypothetical protein A2341_22760 [Deltaproteobacteria bacterium RIFOXYB12_FULL_58_9]|nr:MAG: hypothetical protein A2341_22760 [Deltaproteobacteria bacterium RIFOXYB12_FULL_58_9]